MVLATALAKTIIATNRAGESQESAAGDASRGSPPDAQEVKRDFDRREQHVRSS